MPPGGTEARRSLSTTLAELWATCCPAFLFTLARAARCCGPEPACTRACCLWVAGHHAWHLCRRSKGDNARISSSHSRFCCLNGGELHAKSYSDSHHKSDRQSCHGLRDIGIQSPLSYCFCLFHVSPPMLCPEYEIWAVQYVRQRTKSNAFIPSASFIACNASGAATAMLCTKKTCAHSWAKSYFPK